jgi:RNA polymerase sigma-70 factor (ECF subfamily)
VRRWRDRQRRGRLDTVPSLDEAAESRASRYAREAGLEDQVVRSITLSRSLRMLDPPFREALLLVASQGLSYREAAEVLGEPVGTVKWRVSEAARRMRRILSTEEECDAMRQGQPRPAHLPCGG